MTTITKIPNTPAFACASENGHQEGMSLRDYFASSAMQALLSVQLKNERSAESESIARAAFRMADAMLQARDQ